MLNLTLLSMFFGGTVAEAGRPERREVAEVLRAWVQATDARNVEVVASVFLPDAIQRVQLGGKEMALTTDSYLDMLREGKIGGGATNLEIHGIEVQGALATAVTTRSTDVMVMHDALIFERTDAGWRVASASVFAVPR